MSIKIGNQQSLKKNSLLALSVNLNEKKEKMKLYLLKVNEFLYNFELDFIYNFESKIFFFNF